MSGMEQGEQDKIKRIAAFYDVADEVSVLFNLFLKLLFVTERRS